ncbi:hypothetical protein DM01DRAFT_1175434 [Hesseltinella vesiculosa]|uniref:Uncharacterized protein n=1 Tax=Hesseltinella vesiculosa TaxID=101127 RepID=A0A1X2G4V8_9FUNG|nr:hypothetical protein DM01DRAFT_1175434 [Hesseltinella vesiculosa]
MYQDKEELYQEKDDELSKANREIDHLNLELRNLHEKWDQQHELQKDHVEKAIRVKMDLFMEEQEQGAQAERDALAAEHQDEITKLKHAHEKQIHDLESALSSSKTKAQQQQAKATQQYEDMTSRYQSSQDQIKQLESRVVELEQDLAKTKDANSINDLEQQLRTSQHTADTLERRFRQEMQQTQKDHDDTAQAWLEKHQRSQFELDRLQQSLAEAEQRHQTDMDNLEILYKNQLTGLAATTTEQREAQQLHIDALELKIDELQTSLEDATTRLEQHAASLKASHSSHSRSGVQNDPVLQNERIAELERLLSTQREREQDAKHQWEQLVHGLEQQLQDMKAQQERQLQLQSQPAPSSEETSLSEQHHSQLLVDIAKQHQREIKLLHDQYQQLVDIKDKELEAYAFRVTSLGIARRNDLETCRSEADKQVHTLEEKVEGYEYLSLMI